MAAPSPVVGSTVLTVSTTGMTGMTATAPAARAFDTRWKTASGVRARAASWTRTDSVAGRSAASAARTDSARRGAAVDNRHDRELHARARGGRAPVLRMEFRGEGLTKSMEFRIAGRDGDADLLRDAGRGDTPEGVGEDAVPAQRNLGFWHAVAQALAGAGSHDDDRGDGAGR